nr:zinc finger, CCHC-type [Tanacetum cinerariifolium]
MMEHNNSFMYNDNKSKRKHHDNTRDDPNKKAKHTCWKCGKICHIKRDCKGVNVDNKAKGSSTKGLVDGSSNSLKAIVHVCKDRCWFKTYESLNDGSILHMGNESTTLVHERGCVDLKFSYGKIVSLLNVLHVPNIRKNLASSNVLNNCGYKQVIESNKFILSKHGVFICFGYLSNHMFRLNIINDNVGSTLMSTSKLNDSILWHAGLGHVHFKRMQDMSKDGLIPAFDMDTEKWNKKYFLTFINDASRGIECIFIGYAKYSKAFRFSSVLRPNFRIPNKTKDIGGLVVPEEVTEKVVQQSKPELRKSNRNRTPKNFRHEFQLYLIEGTKDEVSDQHFYCFNVEDDPKIFDETMKSQDVAFWKEAINNNNTWVLADLPLDYFDTYAPVTHISTIRPLIAIHNLIIHRMDVKTAFLNGELDEEVDMTKEFLSSRFSMKDMGEADVIICVRIKHESNKIAILQSYYIKKAISQLEYSRVIGCLMYAMTCTRSDIAFAAGKLSRYTSNLGTQHWQAFQRVFKWDEGFNS